MPIDGEPRECEQTDKTRKKEKEGDPCRSIHQFWRLFIEAREQQRADPDGTEEQRDIECSNVVERSKTKRQYNHRNRTNSSLESPPLMQQRREHGVGKGLWQRFHRFVRYDGKGVERGNTQQAQSKECPTLIL